MDQSKSQKTPKIEVYRPNIRNSLVTQKYTELGSLTVLPKTFINHLFDIWFTNHNEKWLMNTHLIGVKK